MKVSARTWTLAPVASGLGLAILALLLVTPQLVQADTHTVCAPSGCDFTTIQAAINAANPGDTIHVAAGTYHEVLYIAKSITLLGGWDSNFQTRTPRTSILDGTGIAQTDSAAPDIGVRTDIPPLVNIEYPPTEEVVLLEASVQANYVGSGIKVIIDGFEITGGNVVGDGGGIDVQVEDDSRVVINDNWIHHNNASDRGGGIYAAAENRSGLEITNNDVETNTAQYGGGLHVTAWMSTTLVVDGNDVISNTASDNYGGAHIAVRRFGRFSVDGNVVVRNTSDRYGGLLFMAQSNSHGTFDGNEFTDNTAFIEHGGARIEITDNATSTFNDNLFRDNDAGTSWGGMYVLLGWNARLVGDGLVLDDNAAGSGSGGGGCLSINDGSVLTMTGGVTVTNNVARAGDNGGLWVDLYAHNHLYLEGLYVYNNRALGGVAGGLRIDSSSAGHNTTILPGARVISNTARDAGGGIYARLADHSSLDLSGSTFERNQVLDGNGGGLSMVELEEGSTLLLNHTSYFTNTAHNGEGGGAYVAMPDDGSFLELVSGSFVSNTATLAGGGLRVETGNHSLPGDEPGLLISGTLFARNMAFSGGGAYFGTCVYGCHRVIDYNEFLQNRADADGGAINIEGYLGDKGSFGSFSHNRVVSNTAGSNGGGVYLSGGLADQGGLAHFNHNTIAGNVAESGAGGAYLGSVHEGSYAQVMHNDVVDNACGTATGGGLSMEDILDGSTLDLRHNTIQRNRAGSGGGGLRLDDIQRGATLWLTDNDIDYNTTHGLGGGILFDDNISTAFVYIQSNSIQHNQAGYGGGCWAEGDLIANEGTELWFTGNLVNHNVAGYEDGGCAFTRIDEGSRVTFEDNQFNYNTAVSNYGGLRFESIDGGSLLWFLNNQVIGNGAGITGTLVTGGDHGGLTFDDIASGSEVHIRHSQISSNTAYFATAGGNYGGIYAEVDEDGVLLSMSDNTIYSNTAQADFGGIAVELEEEARLVMVHNTISANSAATESGGLYVCGGDDSQYFLHRNKVFDNTAGSKGGIWIENRDINDPLWGISENNLIADNVGSGVYLENLNFWSINDTIANNGPYAIYVTGTLTTTAYLSNTIIWGHTWSFTTTHQTTQTLLATYSDIEGGWPGMGNIDQNPKFLNPVANDYHLEETSPAVNQVDPATAPAIDLDGIPRPVPVAGLADMGCYEWFRAGVTLAPDGAGSAKPGEQVAYTLSITNDGNLPDTFAIDVPLNPLAWPITVTPTSVDLAPGASTSLQVKVTVPPGTAEGVANLITVRATSLADGTVQDIATLETTAALAPALTLAPDRAAGALPGGAVIYEHTLTNEANGTDSFQLDSASSLGWSTLVSPTVTTVGKGASALVEVYVWVPASAAPGAVDVTTITATSTADPNVSDTATDTTSRKGMPFVYFLPIIPRNY